MSKNEPSVRDFYGELLKVGDFVIGLTSEAAMLDINGEIKEIHFEGNSASIDIFDPKIDHLYKKLNPLYFSTFERFQERD